MGLKEFSDFTTFDILGQKVNLILSDQEYDYSGYLTAEIDDKYYQLGIQDLDINAAIVAWQMHFDMKLTDDEIKSLMDM